MKHERLPRNHPSAFLSKKKSPAEFAADVALLRAHLHYDPTTGIFTRAKSGHGWKSGEVSGHTTADGYVRIYVFGQYFKAHRLAWVYVHGTLPPHEIDHINAVRADNRIANLRSATRAMNVQNHRSAKATNELGLLGVTKYRSGARYRYKATIVIGSYDTPEEAHSAYIKIKRQLHEGCTL